MATVQTFTYRGRDGAGNLVKGRVDAATEGAVASRLRTMGVAPISIAEAKGTGLNAEINLGIFKKSVGLKDLAIMSRQMSTMISSGLSLLRTLTILTDQSENKTLAEVLASLTKDVEAGVSLSEGMAKHATVFPPIMINLVKAGETGGFLDGALDTVAKNFESEVKLRGTIKSAMAYPVIVLIMAVVAVVAMLVFIVPIFKNDVRGLRRGTSAAYPNARMALRAS